MSKYNLSDLLNEYIGGGRIGTLEISFKDLQDKMDELEKSDKVIVRTLSGPSGDGKVNREFEVVDRDSAVAGGNKQERGFTVYDYKFGFDPASEDEFMNEYPFSVGGNDLKLAMELIDGVKPYGVREDLFSKDGGSEDNVDNIDKVASPSAKGKGYSSAIGSERSEDNKEQSDITQTTKPMYEKEDKKELPDSIKKAEQDQIEKDARKSRGDIKEDREKDLINAMRFHLMSYDKGIIDKDDLIQAMEELAYGDIKAPGMREDNDPSGADLEGDPDEKVMGENGDVEDYADEIAEADNVEITTILNNVRKHLVDKFDRRYSKPEFDLYMDSLERDMRRSEKELMDVKSMSMDDHEADFEDYIRDRYELEENQSLKEHFKRFM